MEKKKFELTRGKILAAALIVVGIILGVYFFMPRSVGDIAGCGDNVCSVTVSDFRGGYNDTASEILVLDEDDAEDFIEALDDAKVFISPVYTKMGKGGAVTISKNITFDISGGTRPKNIYVFTDKILIIDGKQYTLYGDSFISYFLDVLNA